MRVSCIQLDMDFCDVEKNYLRAEELIYNTVKNEKTDVVLLPETWSTGYYPKNDLMSFCEPAGGRIKKTFSLIAKDLGVNIVAGSIANNKNGMAYNTSYVFDRVGDVVAEYDKIHLFTPMNEDNFFGHGEKTAVFELDGHKCAVIICYDIRFPELVRKLALEGVEILFVVSQWPSQRIEHLKILSSARAIENQMFVAVCNSCGKAGDTVFGGNSRIVDPWGNVLAFAGEKEEIITADCDFSTINQIRSSINIFDDRKPELYST